MSEPKNEIICVTDEIITKVFVKSNPNVTEKFNKTIDICLVARDANLYDSVLS